MMQVSFLTSTAAAFLLTTSLVWAKTSVNVDDLDPLKECKRRDVASERNGKVYMYGGQSWVKNGTEKPFQVTNHYLRIADFTTPRNLSDPALLTAKDIPPNITIFQEGAFWASPITKKLYIAGGQVNDEGWLTREGEFIKVAPKLFKGSTIFSYDIEADNWSSEQTPLQPSHGDGVTDSFCCGSFAYEKWSGRSFFYSGKNYPGSRKMEPTGTAGYIGVTFDQAVGFGNLLTFDEASFRWSNVSTDQQLTTAVTESGQFVYLPGTESSAGGIGVLLGGTRRDTNQENSLRRVLVYSSTTSTWYSQVTTTTTSDSSFPDGRLHFCAVATSASDNSSHNIYIYGGESQTQTDAAYDDMWILSVPSFRWIKIDVESPPRKSLGCTTLAGGKYLLTYGGVEAGWGQEGDIEQCDMETAGLRLFDTEALKWTAAYEGSSQEQGAKVPRPVYEAVGGTAQGNATQTAPSAGFETPGLATLFQKSSSNTSTPPSASPPSKSDTNSSSATSSKAIAGGVIGGVGCVVALILGILFFRRRRASDAQNAHEAAGELAYRKELADQFESRKELAGEFAQELDNRTRKPVYEMWGGHGAEAQEMDAEQASPLPQQATGTMNTIRDR